MKKISLYVAVAGALLGMASCAQDREPVYHAPEKFELNEPVMQDQLIILSEEGTLDLTCSQPYYGFAAAANYSVEMSLTEDFTDFYTITPLDEHSAQIKMRQRDVATGYCSLLGLESEEDYTEQFPNGFDVVPIYFRAQCVIPEIEGSDIKSNIVVYNQIQPYFAVAVPGYIYLVGQPSGWATPDESQTAHYADWRLFENADAIGSKVYIGTFDIPATGDDGINWPMFRFYTALTGWDADSYGVQEPDEAVQFPDAFADGTFEHQLVKGKGSFWFPNWEGGKMTIVVDMSDPNNMTVQMMAGEVSVGTTKYIYLVGSISGWMAPGIESEAAYAPYRLGCSDGSGIYTGEFDAPAGHVNFRFALELTEDGWENKTQIGSQPEDADVACTFTNGTYTGPYVSGKGNWAFELDEPGKISMTVDTNTGTVTYVLE